MTLKDMFLRIVEQAHVQAPLSSYEQALVEIEKLERIIQAHQDARVTLQHLWNEDVDRLKTRIGRLEAELASYRGDQK